jgi:uncharacterized protein YkwD
MARTRFHERLGAFGLTAVMGVMGAGTLVRACSTATPKPAVRAPMQVASTVVDLVNKQRAAAGLAPVVEDGRLDTAANGQSTDQADHLAMSHTGSNGSNGGDRIEWVGFSWSAWGENVAAGQTTSQQVMEAWMNSPGHRANILKPTFTNIGVAAVKGANGVVYWTMDLATPS